jgi:hypothetical protein
MRPPASNFAQSPQLLVFALICGFLLLPQKSDAQGLAQFIGKIRAKYQSYQVFISIKKCNTKIRSFLVSKYSVIHFMKCF